MKATRVEGTSFRPITLQIEISTQEELDLIRSTVDSMAPLNSVPASLNQMQYDFAFKVLVLLRNTTAALPRTELEVK